MDNNKFSEWAEDRQTRFVDTHHKMVLQTYYAQISSRSMYIRNLVFMNGGALVAILSAKAVLMANDVRNIEWTLWPMVCFSIGLILAALLNGFTYLRYARMGNNESGAYDWFVDDNYTYQDYKKDLQDFYDKEAPRWRFEVVLGVVGLICFILGAASGIYNLA